MYTVQVLLSTYNGETYLKEQLDSILNQKNVAVKLFVRDDRFFRWHRGYPARLCRAPR